jgi:hypothetical protein
MAAISPGYEGDRFTVGLDIAARRWWVVATFAFLLCICFLTFATGDELDWKVTSVLAVLSSVSIVARYLLSPDFRPELAVDSAGLTELRSNAWFSWNEVADVRLEQVLADERSVDTPSKVEHHLVVSTEPRDLVAQRVRGRGASNSRIVDGSLRVRLDYLTPDWSEVVAAVEARSGREVPVVRSGASMRIAPIGGGNLAAAVGVAAIALAVVAFVANAFPLIGLGLVFLALYCASAVRSQWRHRRFAERGLPD